MEKRIFGNFKAEKLKHVKKSTLKKVLNFFSSGLKSLIFFALSLSSVSLSHVCESIMFLKWRKPWSSGRALGSRSEGRIFNPRPMLDRSGVKAMPGSIPTPSSGSLKKNKKIQVARWGTPKTYLKKYVSQKDFINLRPKFVK